MTRDRAEVGGVTITAREDTEVIQNFLTAARDSRENTRLTGICCSTDEDDYDRRRQRRRYEEPMSVRIRKQLLAIAESPLKRVEDEVSGIARMICDNYEDEECRNNFYELAVQLVVEQPFKIPFVAAVILVINTLRSEMVDEVLSRTAARANQKIREGEWREVKLLMKFLGGLQGLLEGDGVWSVLQDLLTKAVDLQTENNEEVSAYWGCHESIADWLG